MLRTKALWRPSALVKLYSLLQPRLLREPLFRRAQLEVLNQLLIPLLGLTGMPALLEFLEVKLNDHKEDMLRAAGFQLRFREPFS